MTLFNIILVLIMFLAIDYLANLGKKKNAFLQTALLSTLLSTLLIFTAFIALLLGVSIILLISAVIDLGNDLFITGLLMILTSGIIEFFLLRYFIKRWFNDVWTLTVVEYFIQWLLVYLTLYQVMTQSLSRIKLEVDIHTLFHILNIEALNLTLLPVLLISWISLIMHKINLRQ
ncbi:hypothetical protein HMPREF2997_10005 [Staphylococcus sp. HMSC057C08]|uniref:SA1002 family membrane protein n=1 Tax=Staphylococcus sp. HMSC057C08 TaxID=1739501 RepID=UPI0008A34966|nr:hypothetical protein [Staphylococcus sp. HMSC057C08]OFP24450.1 hypothetical protein HMPREF2997_10005 [Staphylococcus sp. HMSC057C08]